MHQSNQPLSPLTTLPTMHDLPAEDPEENGLPDLFHLLQPRLLDEALSSANCSVDRFFTASDLNLYYDPQHPLWYKRPDWFIVLGKSPASIQQELHLSYVLWQEGIAPFLVVELLSPSTESDDLGRSLREVNTPPTKWQVYEQIVRVPYYGIFDRYQQQFRLFRLVATHYEEMPLIEQKFWFDEIQLGLGVWQGKYQETAGKWLRWYDRENNWSPLAVETIELERFRADQAQQKADRLAAQLQSLGIDPDG
jgi:Uma2 family endonuclease